MNVRRLFHHGMDGDIEDLASMQGAYRDNDGIDPGDNLYGPPDPGFTSSEYRPPGSRIPAAGTPEGFLSLAGIGVALGAIAIALSLLIR